MFIKRKELISDVVRALSHVEKDSAQSSEDLQQKVACQIFASTVDTESADLVPQGQMREIEADISSLLA